MSASGEKKIILDLLPKACVWRTEVRGSREMDRRVAPCDLDESVSEMVAKARLGCTGRSILSKNTEATVCLLVSPAKC